MKDYDAQKGVQIDASFALHAENCEKCKRFDPESKPSSAALLCLEGAVLWKRETRQPEKREPATWRPDTWRPLAEVKKVMRYK